MRLAAPLLALACCAPVASAAPRSLQYIPTPPAPPPAPPCACESCVQKDNAVEDCEGFGMNCSCFDGCACEDCVREGNSVAECESTGILCACDAGGGDLPGGDDACGDLTARTKAVTDECCDEPTEDCSSGRPSTCNTGCAAVLLPFFEQCSKELGPMGAGEYADVIALCHGGGRPWPPTWPAAPLPTFSISTGSCTASTTGACFRSPNYPNNYGGDEACTITVSGYGSARATAFATEANYDYVTIHGQTFFGTRSNLGPSGSGIPVATGDTISWKTDSSNMQSGFEICGNTLGCGENGAPNPTSSRCVCAPGIYGRVVPSPGGDAPLCDQGPFPASFTVDGCADGSENCGVYSVALASCTGTNCDDNSATTCGSAPVYQQAATGRVLLRLSRTSDGSATWRIASADALLDCFGIPYAHSASKPAPIGEGLLALPNDPSFGVWQESASSGWHDSDTLTVSPGGGFAPGSQEHPGVGH